MKKQYKIAIVVVVILLLAGAVAMWQMSSMEPWQMKAEKPDHTVSGTVSALTPMPEGSDYTMLVAENESFQLLAREDGKIAVVNKHTGVIWHSNPLEKDPKAVGINMTNMNSQLYITYASEGGKTLTKNSTTDCVNKKWLTWEGVENGIRYLYDFQAAGISIPLEYVLEDDGLRVSVLVDEIQEGSKDQFLTELALLPFFGAMSTDSTGYTFVPDGSGALIYHNNEKASYGAYKQPVYGLDTALVIEKFLVHEEIVRLPVFGITNGQSGFVAVIESGDSVATINAMTSGTINSYNNVYTSFRFRPYTMGSFYQGNTYAHDGVGDGQVTLMLPSVQPKNIDYTVKYILLEDEELSYVDMAKAYREYMIAEQGLASSVPENDAPLYVEFLGGIRKDDVVLGVKIPLLQRLTAFDEAKMILSTLMDNGVSDLAVKYTGWQDGGIESEIPAGISFESKLGGRKGYEEFKAFADANDIDLFMDFDFLNFYESGNGLSTFTDSVQTIEKTPTYLYNYNYNTLEKYNEGRWRLLTPRLVVSALNKMLDDHSAMDGANISLSTMGSMVYSDFTNKSNGLDRANTRQLWEEAFQLVDEKSAKLMVDGGNAYSLPYVTHVYNAPLKCTMYDIEDEAVPFFQIVMHGYVSYATEPLNLSSNPQRTVLNAVETGSSISACLMAAENHVLADTNYEDVYSGNYEAWVDILSDEYVRISGVLKDVSAQTIVDHEKLATNVYKTTYSNGAVVYVNYGTKAVDIDGQTIEAMDFVYLQGKEAQ